MSISTPLVPSRPTLQSFEAIAIWQREAGIDQILGAVKEYLDKQQCNQAPERHPSAKTVTTLRVMYSPEASAPYARNGKAIDAAFHKKAKLPWSVSVQADINWMWKNLFTRKGFEHKENLFKLCTASFAVKHACNIDLSESRLRQDDWNSLLLSYAFMSVCMYKNPYPFVQEYVFGAWQEVNLKLLAALEMQNEFWARVLLWRVTLDYVASIYNQYWKSGFLSCSKRRSELRRLLDENHFFHRAHSYGALLKTAPKPFVNQIAANSSIVRKDGDYPPLWSQFVDYLDKVHSKDVPANQKPQIRKYADTIVCYIDKDSDFEHFRTWLLETEDITSIVVWYCERYDIDSLDCR